MWRGPSSASVLSPFSVLYVSCAVFLSHIPSVWLLLVSPSLLTISRSSRSPASSSASRFTRTTWRVAAYLYYYTLKKYVCMCVRAYMCCHVPFNRGSQSAHRTNWSVGLPAVLAHSSFCLSISPTWTPDSLSRSDALIRSLTHIRWQWKGDAGMRKNVSSNYWIVFLTSAFCFFTAGCILEISHSPIGRWTLPHFDWRDLAWHWLLTALWMIPCCGEWWAVCKASSFCYLSRTYCLDTPYH